LEQNGLAGRFLFLPVAGKQRLIEYLRAAHCVLDQFKVGYYGATALEAMSCGKPVVMRIIDRHYDALCPTGSPPVENAALAEQVSDRLHRLATDPRYYADKCTEVRRWITDNHSVKVWGMAYLSLLKACAQGLLPDFRDAPLAAPLKQDEVNYHQEQLKSAPPFPQYVI
jgi:glycosyltransferase involved in cell wall biosynthesis